MTTFNAFPSIEFPAFLSDTGFTDVSDPSDVAAAAEKTLHDGTTIKVWVDHDDEAQRNHVHKFAVHYYPDPSDDEGYAELYFGDSAGRAARAVYQALATSIGGDAVAPTMPVSHAFIAVIANAVNDYSDAVLSDSDGEIDALEARVSGMKLIVRAKTDGGEGETYEFTLTKY